LIDLGAAKQEITRSQYIENLVEAAFRLVEASLSQSGNSWPRREESLAMRFHVGLEVITEDVRSASEALKQQALAEKRASQLAQETRSRIGARPEDTQKQGSVILRAAAAPLDFARRSKATH